MQSKLLILRKEAGLSQQDMADKLNISVTSYGEKERGKSEFSQNEMFCLRDFFGKSLEEIFLPTKSLK